MSIKVFIDGSAGTTGLKLRSLLSSDPEITLLEIPEAKRKDIKAKTEFMQESDITFLCLPDESARESAAAAGSARLIDASTAHRFKEGWTYGLPELSKAVRNEIRTASRVSVPGCHASGFIALTYPLINAGIIQNEAQLACFSLTGYSGGGKSMIADYESATRPPEFAYPRAYALTQSHKHLNEMRTACGLKSPPVFTPVIVDAYSGMQVTVPLFLSGGVTAQEVRETLANHYKDETLISVDTGGNGSGESAGILAFSAMKGSNAMRLFVSGNDERVTLTAIYDNLGKGAAGAAVQCMNIMVGRSETAGLL